MLSDLTNLVPVELKGLILAYDHLISEIELP